MEIFQSFAELSIGILGFTAIVIMFKSQQKGWNKHIFDGMVGHCFQAFLYSILPFILDAFHATQVTNWTVCSIVLGLVTLINGIIVVFVDKTSGKLLKGLMFLSCLILALLQLANITGIWGPPDKGTYIIGITWHLFQAMLIFTMIVTKKQEENGPIT